MDERNSYGVTRTKRDGTEATEYLDSREAAEDAFDRDKETLDPEAYESVELIRTDWYEHSGESLDYHNFGK